LTRENREIALNKYVMVGWSGNFTAAFLVSFSVFVPDIEGIQNKAICL